jgi:hypothetical protein
MVVPQLQQVPNDRPSWNLGEAVDLGLLGLETQLCYDIASKEYRGDDNEIRHAQGWFWDDGCGRSGRGLRLYNIPNSDPSLG